MVGYNCIKKGVNPINKLHFLSFVSSQMKNKNTVILNKHQIYFKINA